MGFLEDILDRKASEVERAKACTSMHELEQLCRNVHNCASLKAALDGPAPKIIAEIKRASPSRGNLRVDLNAGDTARIYRDNGAAAISVLTDEAGFKGSLDDVREVNDIFESTESGRLPILRKDFLIDPYQIWEARAAGADAVLLIVASLDKIKLAEMMCEADGVGVEALVEVHNEEEMRIAVDSGAKVLGINNRDLRTFDVDPDTTLRLAPLAPEDVTLVVESGIRTPDDVRRYAQDGFRAFLIGEALVTAPEIGTRLKEFIECL